MKAFAGEKLVGERVLGEKVGGVVVADEKKVKHP